MAGATVPSTSRSGRRELAAFIALASLGLIGAVFTIVGMDPANAQQLSDFTLFYFPTMQEFSRAPVEALGDYNAAPTPLYFMLQGGVLALFGDAGFVRALSVLLGLATAWAVWTFPASKPRRMVALAVLLISPYFRGQVWHSNGDVLALLLMLFAIRPQATTRGRIGSILMASVTVYVRQTFVFIPAYLFVKGVFKDRWPALAPLAVAAIAAVPMIGLVALWHGIAPPRYAGHLALSDVPATLGIGLTIAAIYLCPFILLRALKPSRLIADIRTLPVWLHAVILGVAAIYVGAPSLFANVQGGGTVYVALKQISKAAGLPLMLGFAPAFVVSAYAMAIVVRGFAWRNSLVLLATLAMSISVLIYQRYFDPLIPLLLLLHVRRPELAWLERRGLTWVMALPPAAVALAASLTH
jgi:hypothetical protein